MTAIAASTSGASPTIVDAAPASPSSAAHARAEHAVVVDEDDLDGLLQACSRVSSELAVRRALAGRRGADRAAGVRLRPRCRARGGAPWRCRRGAPSGPGSTAARRAGPRGISPTSNPAPWSRTNASTPPGPISSVGVTGGAPCRTALSSASRMARTSAWPCVVERPVAGDDELDGHAVQVLDLVRGLGDRSGERRVGAGTARHTATSAARAPGRGPAGSPHAGSSDLRWMSARVCSTESCRCAAMSARSVARASSACS